MDDRVAKSTLQSRLVLGIVAALLLAGRGRRTGTADRSGCQLCRGRAIAHGGEVYLAACAGCHGVAGRGSPDVAPPLDSAAWFAERLAELNHQGDLRGYIEAAVLAGRPVPNEEYSSIMPAWHTDFGGPLRSDEIRDVTSFVLNWQATPAPAEPIALAAPEEGGAMAQGKALYGSLDCLGCHGWPDRGGITGPDLAGIAARGGEQMPGLDAESYIRVSLLAPSAFIASGCPTGPCPDMMPRDDGARLSPREIEQLVRYLLTLQEPPSRQRPPGAPPPLAGGLVEPQPSPVAPALSLERGQALYEDHCTMCHGDQGQGGIGTALGAVLISVDPFAYTRAATAQGVPGMMPAWAQELGGPLTEADLDDVSAYVVALPGQ